MARSCLVTPLAAFMLQAALVRDIDNALALSAVALAVLYVGLAQWLRSRQEPRLELLIDSFRAMALVFATLAVPLYFEASANVRRLGARRGGHRLDRRSPGSASRAVVRTRVATGRGGGVPTGSRRSAVRYRSARQQHISGCRIARGRRHYFLPPSGASPRSDRRGCVGSRGAALCLGVSLLGSGRCARDTPFHTAVSAPGTAGVFRDDSVERHARASVHRMGTVARTARLAVTRVLRNRGMAGRRWFAPLRRVECLGVAVGFRRAAAVPALAGKFVARRRRGCNARRHDVAQQYFYSRRRRTGRSPSALPNHSCGRSSWC